MSSKYWVSLPNNHKDVTTSLLIVETESKCITPYRYSNEAGDLGVVGIYDLGKFILLAVQARKNPRIIAIEKKSKKLVATLTDKRINEPHSIITFKNLILFTNTGSNQIFSTEFNGEKFKRLDEWWTAPGCNKNEDQIHLNDIVCIDNNICINF